MNIFCNDRIDPAQWNQFAGPHVFHRYEWRHVIESAYGLKPYFVLAVEDESFALYPSFLKGDCCVSMPFTYIAGYLSNCPELEQSIAQSIHAQGYRECYRTLIESDGAAAKITCMIKMTDANSYLAGLSHKMRHQIKKSESQGLEFVRTRDLDLFYGLYCRKMHQHGTPPHKRVFFQLILNAFAESAIFASLYQGRPVAAMFCIEGMDAACRQEPTFHILWAASDDRWDRLYVNYFTYWKSIEAAADRGLHMIDLGTARSGSSQQEFKKKWRPMFYAVEERGAAGKDLASRRSSEILSTIWTRSPAWFVNAVGPHLRKYII